MTNEELEKKAEESFNNKLQKDVCYCTYNEEKIYKDGYIAGAKENGIEWHDLRKNPNDLPKRDGEYLTNIGVLVFDSSLDNRWCTLLCEACDFYEEVIDEVIAWCEIPSWREIPK